MLKITVFPDKSFKHRFGAEETLHITLFSWVYFFLLVLSDANKRFLYDVGVYDSDEEDGDGMCDFLDEMAKMMGQASSSTAGSNSFESLQDLFEEMFPGNTTGSDSTSMSGTTSLSSETNTSMTGNKRNSCEMNFGEVSTKGSSDFSFGEVSTKGFSDFSFGEVSTKGFSDFSFGEVSTKGFSDFSSFEGNSLNGHLFCVGVGEVNTESSSKGSKHKNARKANGYTRNP
ncbi:uncharacterized protein LOC116264139 isoform X2 [Nymphaea colorata]|nr:uncharacterized protein LOC116264139 isoform X2 [Nymphaea colorata]XP_031500028.1 uncharacterized protein LOC116264139 isoform X2 [Nymphaea colorata]